MRDPFLLEVLRLHPNGLGASVVLLPDEETGRIFPITDAELDDATRDRYIKISIAVMQRAGVPK